MRTALAHLLVACIASSIMAETASRPRILSTNVPDTEVRSGPGSEYYLTQKLPEGTNVEAFHQEGEWWAIRPPADSFSWIRGDDLRIEKGNDVARTRRETQTRVGSLLSDDRYVAYITLSPGERVRLIEVPSTVHASSWLRIEPPAGEFRWIHQDDLSSQPPARPSSRDLAEHNSNAKDIREEVEHHDLETTTQSLRDSLAQIRQAIHVMAGNDEDQDAPPPKRNVQHAANEEPLVPPAWSGQQDGASGSSLDPPRTDLGLLPSPPNRVSSEPPVSTTSLPTTSLPSELTRIAADLTSQVCRPASEWNLVSLRQRTQAVIDVSNTATVREQATGLLARIAQFEDIQRRQRQLDAATAARGQRLASGLGRNSTASPLASAPSLPSVDLSQYDGYGWLMPVVSQNRRVPRYVLTDQQGNILQFVTPSPGLNLAQYENKRVGIYGTRGFLPSMKQPHLVAERVVSMDMLR